MGAQEMSSAVDIQEALQSAGVWNMVGPRGHILLAKDPRILQVC